MTNKFNVESFKTREEWLAAREKSIGGSEASAVLGLSKYQSPFSLWALKTGKIQPQEETLAMRVGHAVEPLIASELEAQGYRLQDPGLCILRSVERPFLSYSPDRLLMQRFESTTATLSVDIPSGLAEFKKDYGGQDWDTEASSSSIVQLQHGLLITGLSTGVIAALIGLGQSLRVYDIAPELELQAIILERVEQFWHDYVVKDTPPPTDWSESTTRALASLYPKDTGTEIELPAEEWRGRLMALQVAKNQIELAKESEAAVKNALRAALGENSSAVIPGVGRVTWKLTKRKEYTVKATEYRDLRVKMEKE